MVIERITKYFIFIFVVYSGDFACDAATGLHWSYEDEYHWPGICLEGHQQSPINIITEDALLDKHQVHIRGALKFRGYENVNTSAVNNGHTLQWNREESGSGPTLSGGPLRGNYTFLQMHFHWLSEHAIDGYKYPLEIHLVHMKTGLEPEEAVKRPDGLAVIGVFFKVLNFHGSEHTMEQVMQVVPQLMEKTEEPVRAGIIDLSRFLSPEPQSFYTYHGSLTTPYCQEVVTWIVMEKPLVISDLQYKTLTKVNVGGIDNYRSLQATNRVVYRSVASCSAIAVPSFLAFVTNLLVCSAASISSVLSKGACKAWNIKRKIFGDSSKICKDE